MKDFKRVDLGLDDDDNLVIAVGGRYQRDLKPFLGKQILQSNVLRKIYTAEEIAEYWSELNSFSALLIKEITEVTWVMGVIVEENTIPNLTFSNIYANDSDASIDDIYNSSSTLCNRGDKYDHAIAFNGDYIGLLSDDSKRAYASFTSTDPTPPETGSISILIAGIGFN